MNAENRKTYYELWIQNNNIKPEWRFLCRGSLKEVERRRSGFLRRFSGVYDPPSRAKIKKVIDIDTKETKTNC